MVRGYEGKKKKEKKISESQGDWIGYKFSSKELVHTIGYLTIHVRSQRNLHLFTASLKVLTLPWQASKVQQS